MRNAAKLEFDAVSDYTGLGDLVERIKEPSRSIEKITTRSQTTDSKTRSTSSIRKTQRPATSPASPLSWPQCDDQEARSAAWRLRILAHLCR